MEEDIKNQIESHFELMTNLVSEFESNMNKKLALESKVDSLKQEMYKFENDTKLIVNNEVDDKGKKIYSNEEMRNIAMSKILSSNESYRTVKKEQEEKDRELNHTKAQISMLDNRLSIMKNQSSLLSILGNNQNNILKTKEIMVEVGMSKNFQTAKSSEVLTVPEDYSQEQLTALKRQAYERCKADCREQLKDIIQ